MTEIVVFLAWLFLALVCIVLIIIVVGGGIFFVKGLYQAWKKDEEE